MIEGIVSYVLSTYLYDYLMNFDKDNLKISLLSGKINLRNLILNDKLLQNVPIPLNLKYGRIGSIDIELPSLFELRNPKTKVSISDVFICLS